MASRAGSHAGRGFRYQDAVAACLSLQGWAGISPYGLVIPEGDDDIELHAAAGRVLAQVKSRRENRGLFPIGEIAGFLLKLWERSASQPQDSYELILEREPAGWPGGQQAAGLSELPSILQALPPNTLPDLTGRTRIRVLPNPRENARKAIEQRLGCTTLEADACYGGVLRRAGKLADDNGVREPGGFLGLSISDVELELSKIASAFTSDRIQAALSRGLCEAVDFSTPLEDAEFFNGVDVQPGHVVAGLLVERTVLREAIVEALHERRDVLLKGPSGAGKSALQWDVAYALRHSVRWFRIRRLASEDIADLVGLANSCCASADAPVGFLLDNLGAGLINGWDALAREVAVQPGLYLLGSIREEDIYPLAERHRAVEVPVQAEEEFAQEFWRELRDRGKTAWTHWLEPWAASKGLLLEYAHILTRGARLEETLRQQVATRANDPARHPELELLRLCAAITSIGARIDIGRLPGVLGRTAIEIGTWLPRILNEHLLRNLGDGSMSGFHELRSHHLLVETGHVSIQTEAQTFLHALDAVLEADIGIFLARSLERHSALEGELLDALAEKLNHQPSAVLTTTALNGLGERQIAQVIDTWLRSPEAAQVPLSQMSFVATFGVAGVELPDLIASTPAAPAIALIARLKEQSSQDHLRGRLLSRLSTSTLQKMLEAANDLSLLNALLAAHVGQALAPDVRKVLLGIKPHLLTGDLHQVGALLGTAYLLDPAIAAHWVSDAGAHQLLARIGKEVPWATEAWMSMEPEGLAAACDIRAAPTAYQPDPHGNVVALCELLLACCPTADLVISRLVIEPGQPLAYAGVPVTEKRIPRKNLPPDSLPAWNRRWGAAIKARLAPASYSAYLVQAEEEVARLIPLLHNLFDQLIRNATEQTTLHALGEVHERSRAMVAATLPWFAKDASGRSVGDKNSHLQDILFKCSADLVRRFAKLPEGSGAYIAWLGDILKDTRESMEIEPWQLAPRGAQAKQNLTTLAELIEDLRALAGDAQQRDANPLVLYRRLLAPKGRALAEARTSARKKTATTRRGIERDLIKAFKTMSPGAYVYVRPAHDNQLAWPLLEAMVTFELERIFDWPALVSSGWAKWRSAVGDTLLLTAMPAVKGMCVPMCSMGGYTQPFPSESHARQWIETTELRPAPEVATRMWGDFTAAVMDVAHLESQCMGLDHRPEIERLAREAARARLQTTKAAIDTRLPQLLRDMSNTLVALVDEDPLQLHNAQLAFLRQELNPVGEVLLNATYACYSVDLGVIPA